MHLVQLLSSLERESVIRVQMLHKLIVFHFAVICLERHGSISSSSSYWYIVEQTEFFNLSKVITIRERKPRIQISNILFKTLCRIYLMAEGLRIYRLKVKVKLATLVEGDTKAPFSIATTPRCRGGCYSFPKIAPLYPWSSPYSAEC